MIWCAGVSEMTTKEGYEVYQEQVHRDGNDQDQLNDLFIRMKDLAKENCQEIPIGFFVAEDGDIACAEFEHRNSTVLATRNKDGIFEAGY